MFRPAWTAILDDHMSIYYTADTHFHHRNIINLCNRGFADIEQMNTELIARWNNAVKPSDTVYVLGDFSLSRKALALVGDLQGTKVLIAGNHDLCWTGHSNQSRAVRSVGQYLDAGFAEVHPGGVLDHHQIGQHHVRLSHLPYHGDSHHDERYRDLRPTDDGTPLICGHVHDTWRHLYNTDGRVHRRQINVGVDVWDFTPVPENTLADLLDALLTDSPRSP